MRSPALEEYNQSIHTISLFLLDRDQMIGGVHHQGGLTGQQVRVAQFGGVSILHVKAAEWRNPPDLGNHITAQKPAKHTRQNKMASNHYNQNVDEIDSAGDNLSVKSDSQANQWNQTEVIPATTMLMQKAASPEQTKSRKQRFVHCLCACLAFCTIAVWTSPTSLGLHVKTSISLPRVGEVRHLPRVPRLSVSRP